MRRHPRAYIQRCRQPLIYITLFRHRRVRSSESEVRVAHREGWMLSMPASGRCFSMPASGRSFSTPDRTGQAFFHVSRASFFHAPPPWWLDSPSRGRNSTAAPFETTHRGCRTAPPVARGSDYRSRRTGIRFPVSARRRTPIPQDAEHLSVNSIGQRATQGRQPRSSACSDSRNVSTSTSNGATWAAYRRSHGPRGSFYRALLRPFGKPTRRPQFL